MSRNSVSKIKDLFSVSESLNSSSEETLSNSLVSYEANSNKLCDSVDSVVELPVGINAPCKAGNFILVSSVGPDALYRHIRSFCKSYRCRFCGPKKVYFAQRAFTKAITEFKLNVFATLTLDPKNCTATDSVRYIKKAWNKFRILQKREFNRNLDFIAVIEFQKSGYAHLHILFNEYISHTWLKTKWTAVGGGKIVDIRESDLGSAKYLAKYLGKQMLENPDAKFRFYSTSQTINLKKLAAGNKDELTYKFGRISEMQSRNILRNYISSDILDKRNYILGFKSSRQLKV